MSASAWRPTPLGRCFIPATAAGELEAPRRPQIPWF